VAAARLRHAGAKSDAVETADESEGASAGAASLITASQTAVSRRTVGRAAGSLAARQQTARISPPVP